MAKAKEVDPSVKLDAIDQKIIAILRKDGRATNQELARRLGMAAATVSARIRRLEASKAMKVVAVTDFAAIGYKVLLAVGVQVQGRPAEHVAQDLAKLPEVFSVHVVTGARDIETLVALHDFDELHSLLLRDIAKIKGIRTIECGIAAEVVKYNFEVAPIS
ncbi:MAG: Lrp/AsnC family transcriptional regulator [Gammaproteobacteria bacterium]|nr:Lrp/AsnC family transcriptional regulator [Gammaproteobacteria bacterium]